MAWNIWCCACYRICLNRWLASVIFSRSVIDYLRKFASSPRFPIVDFAEAQGSSVASHPSFVTGCRENFCPAQLPVEYQMGVHSLGVRVGLVLDGAFQPMAKKKKKRWLKTALGILPQSGPMSGKNRLIPRSAHHKNKKKDPTYACKGGRSYRQFKAPKMRISQSRERLLARYISSNKSVTELFSPEKEKEKKLFALVSAHPDKLMGLWKKAIPY